MYNRHVFDRDRKQFQMQKKISESLQKLNQKHQGENEKKSHHYKARVNDFLVQMANHPLVLGQYQPPIKNIVRPNEQYKNLANAQLYINGFKTNRERIQRAIQNQKILDLNPATINNAEQRYRPREFPKQIQPGMRFANSSAPKMQKSKSSLSLPRLNNKKMHFKAIEEFGNGLQSMKLNHLQMASLVNRLQTLSGPGQVNPLAASMVALKECKLNKEKHFKTIQSSLA